MSHPGSRTASRNRQVLGETVAGRFRAVAKATRSSHKKVVNSSVVPSLHIYQRSTTVPHTNEGVVRRVSSYSQPLFDRVIAVRLAPTKPYIRLSQILPFSINGLQCLYSSRSSLLHLLHPFVPGDTVFFPPRSNSLFFLPYNPFHHDQH